MRGVNSTKFITSQASVTASTVHLNYLANKSRVNLYLTRREDEDQYHPLQDEAGARRQLA